MTTDALPDAFTSSLAAHRAELLRHCYRMLGSFHDAEEVVQEVLTSAWTARESYAGKAPLRHWLFRIATNACLNARRANRVRILPDRAAVSSAGNASIGVKGDPETFVTAAPDAALFADSRDLAQITEDREQVALAFVALLQDLPPRQRAALLLKDVVGFSVDEIADALEMSEGAVASALHRARETLPATPANDREPPPEILRAYIRCWETRDLEGLLALLREDVILTMPPWSVWFQGRAELERFFTTPGFTSVWSSGFRLTPTRANGHAAVIFYRDAGATVHSVQLLRFDGTHFTHLSNLIGPAFLYGFEKSSG